MGSFKVILRVKVRVSRKWRIKRMKKGVWGISPDCISPN